MPTLDPATLASIATVAAAIAIVMAIVSCTAAADSREHRNDARVAMGVTISTCDGATRQANIIAADKAAALTAATCAKRSAGSAKAAALDADADLTHQATIVAREAAGDARELVQGATGFLTSFRSWAAAMPDLNANDQPAAAAANDTTPAAVSDPLQADIIEPFAAAFDPDRTAEFDIHPWGTVELGEPVG